METGTYHYLTQPNEEIISSPQPVSAVQLVLKNGNKITLDNPPSSRETLNNNATLHAKKQEINYATKGKETAEIDEIYHTIIIPKYGEIKKNGKRLSRKRNYHGINILRPQS